MLISDIWAALAESHGIELGPRRAGHVADIVLSGPELPATEYDIRTVDVLSPSRVHRFAASTVEVRALVLTRAATENAVATAAAAGVSVLVVPENGSARGTLIDATGTAHQIRTALTVAETRPATAPKRPGKEPWGMFALAFALLSDGAPRTQRALAEQLGLSQPRVSQALRAQLAPFVVNRQAGWTVSEPTDLLSWLASAYPGPTTEAGWLSLEDPVPATRAVVRLLDDQGVRFAVTGQVAADEYAPWARPTRSTILVESLTDLSAAGCTSVPVEQATVVTAVPEDPKALLGGQDRAGLRLADPWRTWLTLAQDGDTAAADHLRDVLLRARAVVA
ncbi:hypothetical protein [Cellulomonas sp. NTE-D12]|uniref:hypothetical protein n=1 Tax=Cellulomonas sp. NTE-D12 TaxID=2962632 RepID=UPI0030813DF1|nr:hypothetical protein CELD12_05970 [Cellulomonas sp. NTE-D12]